jgi:subtilisin family serine protease
MSLALPRRRALAAPAIVLTCVATLSAVPGPAGADDDRLLPGGPVAATRTAPVPVTLVTGDRVLLSTSADGTPSGVIESDGDHYLRRFGDDLYVIPVEAEAALAADALDLELFNVTGLVEQGYDDEHSDALPLIVEGDLPRARGAVTLEVEDELESIDAAAVTVDKDNLEAAYDQLFGGTTRAAGSVGKVWLDAKVEPSDVDLDPATGVEQTGAPRAWDRGFDGTGTRVAVLDTGYDAEHPDLADRVVAAQDFTGQGIDDSAGHGTHVASTIAGDGTADAARTGMAPGADLLIGKVLGWDGGQLSWIVGGMEWAVAQGADVVNMSLGSDQPTDCTDPMSQAAAALTEQTKTLFVVAAGNSAAHETVSSPGCVEGVLTVGAVDDRGETAWFSSRGAVLGTHGLKPDIAAPGVDIIGAQAGSPGGIHYVAMSGTSMATPHVVGAAALVRQAHPDWTAQQLKAALTASVKDSPEHTVYAQGAGELWTPGAIDATVTSDVSVEIADFDWPHGPDERVSGTVTYTNDADRDVRLSLDLEDVTGDDGGRVPNRLLELGDRFVTVPAHGTATVEVDARGDIGGLRDSAYGGIGGRIVATGRVGQDRLRVTTAVGMYLEPRTVEVTVRAIDRNGDPATSGNLDITDLHQPNRALYLFTGEDVTLRLRAGSHFLSSFIRTTEADGTFSYSHLVDPDRRFTHDTTLVLDARDARPVSVRGDRPMTIRSGSFGVQRTWDGWVVGDSLFAERDPEFFATPTDRVDIGDLTYGTYLRTFAPEVPTEDSEYVYNLAFTEEDRVPSDLSYRVSDRRLARVDESWYAQRQPWEPEEWTRVVVDDGTGPFYSSSGDRVAAPGYRTAYYSPGVAWQQHASSGGFRKRPETWFDRVRTYRAGDRRETEWFKLPTQTAMAVNRDGSPARIAERQGSLVGFAFPTWQDSVEGRYAAGGFRDIGGLSLWQDGEYVGHNPFPSGTADIGDGTHELTVEVTQERTSRHEYWELGRGTVSRFTFRTSRPQGETTAALPLALPRYDAPVDERNLAPAGPGFPVGVTFHGQDGYDPGRLRSFTAKVTFDQVDPVGETPLEDYAWTEVPVERRGDRWVALVDNTAGAGRTASLWIAAEDSHGTRTEQFTVSLYGVQ